MKNKIQSCNLLNLFALAGLLAAPQPGLAEPPHPGSGTAEPTILVTTELKVDSSHLREIKLAPGALDPGRPRGLAVYEETYTPDSEWKYAFRDVLWANDWQSGGPRLGFFTEGQPKYPGVVLQLVAGGPRPRLESSCENWSNVPGAKAMVYFNIQSSAPGQAQVAAARRAVTGLTTPVLSVGQLPPGTLASFKAALAGQSYGWLRAVPVAGFYACAAAPDGWVKVDFGTSPNQQTNQQIAAALASLHQAQAAAAVIPPGGSVHLQSDCPCPTTFDPQTGGCRAPLAPVACNGVIPGINPCPNVVRNCQVSADQSSLSFVVASTSEVHQLSGTGPNVAVAVSRHCAATKSNLLLKGSLRTPDPNSFKFVLQLDGSRHPLFLDQGFGLVYDPSCQPSVKTRATIFPEGSDPDKCGCRVQVP